MRGATINAIASSMPELLTSLFFLFILDSSEGFSAGIGTTAGSAIYNGMVIPSLTILAVSYIALNGIQVPRKVLLRDGIALLTVEFLFLVVIRGSSLDWYHGLFLMSLYWVYLAYLFLSIRGKKSSENHHGEAEVEDLGPRHGSAPSFFRTLITLDLVGMLKGKGPIGSASAWRLLTVSTLMIAGVCYFLVLACEWIGSETYMFPGLGELHGLGIPIMFVALILASIASSFPDTILSIIDARKGKHEDAISNALGSNIFDVCFALGLPLFLYALIRGPIVMSDEVAEMSSELRLLLWLLTGVIVIIFVSGKKLGRGKAVLLMLLYFGFVLYVVGRSVGHPVSESISEGLVNVLKFVGIHPRM